MQPPGYRPDSRVQPLKEPGPVGIYCDIRSMFRRPRKFPDRDGSPVERVESGMSRSRVYSDETRTHGPLYSFRAVADPSMVEDETRHGRGRDAPRVETRLSRVPGYELAALERYVGIETTIRRDREPAPRIMESRESQVRNPGRRGLSLWTLGIGNVFAPDPVCVPWRGASPGSRPDSGSSRENGLEVSPKVDARNGY